MLCAGLFDQAANRTYLELGAGKGYLSLMMARATAARRFVLNDCRTFQLKADRLLRRLQAREDRHLAFVRLQADLKDFVVAGALHELDSAQNCAQPSAEWSSRTMIGVGKHLCGAVTDYALRSLLGSCSRCSKHSQAAVPMSASSAASAQVPALQAGDPPVKPEAWLAGLSIAPCCHFRCSWQSYVGKRTILDMGFAPREFEMLCWVAGMQQTVGLVRKCQKSSCQKSTKQAAYIYVLVIVLPMCATNQDVMRQSTSLLRADAVPIMS